MHLGKALGDEFESGGAHLREFEDGWFAVNAGTAPVTVKAPGGASVRVIDRGNFKDASSMPLVQNFTLGAKRAVVLLKDGKLIDNGDN